MFDGNTWIVTRRQKTHTPSNVRLLDIPLKILKELGDPSRETVFKIPSNNCCNDYLIALGKKCGIRTTQIYAKITNQKISEDMEELAGKLAGFSNF